MEIEDDFGAHGVHYIPLRVSLLAVPVTRSLKILAMENFCYSHIVNLSLNIKLLFPSMINPKNQFYDGKTSSMLKLTIAELPFFQETF